MKAFGGILIIFLALCAAIVFLYPLVPWLALPETLHASVLLRDFPYFQELSSLANRFLTQSMVGIQETIDAVIGDVAHGSFSAYLLVSLISVLVSIVIERTLCKPLMQGGLSLLRLPCACVMNVVSVLFSYWLFRRFLVGVVLDEWLASIPIFDIEGLAGQVAQFVMSLGVGAIVVCVLLTVFAASMILRRIVLPLVGCLLRTALFVFAACALMFIARDPSSTMAALPLLACSLCLGGLVELMYCS